MYGAFQDKFIPVRVQALGLNQNNLDFLFKVL